MTAYYNEIDPFPAQWLRNLIAAGHIAPGEVDTRSIAEVQPDDLRGFTQCHFFAGIAGWSAALRLAGWDDDRPIWTGSCPCQPFSAAGKQRGTDDERHLWPVFASLIRECRPSVVAGEQVASALGRSWLASVRADLESMGYAVGAADLCAASVGAPHIRQRLWWVADLPSERRREAGASGGRPAQWAGDCCEPCVLADALHAGRPERRPGAGQRQAAGRGGADERMADRHDAGLEVVGVEHARAERTAAKRGGAAGELGDAEVKRRDGGGTQGSQRYRSTAISRGDTSPWHDLVWLPCRDGKARPTQSFLFGVPDGLPAGVVAGSADVGAYLSPLARGIPNRVGMLRAYGNAIVPALAAEFIQAFRECAP